RRDSIRLLRQSGWPKVLPVPAEVMAGRVYLEEARKFSAAVWREGGFWLGFHQVRENYAAVDLGGGQHRAKGPARGARGPGGGGARWRRGGRGERLRLWSGW